MLILFKQTEQDLNIIFVNVIDFIVIREIINETDMNMGSQSKKLFKMWYLKLFTRPYKTM